MQMFTRYVPLADAAVFLLGVEGTGELADVSGMMARTITPAQNIENPT